MTTHTSDPGSADLTALVEALTQAGTTRHLEPGDIICREHDDSDEAYVVLDGAIEARVDGHAGPFAVATHGPGAIVGEVTTLIGGQRTATLAAVEPSTISVVERDRLHEVFGDHPDASGAVLRAARERTDRSRVAALLSEELEATDGAIVAAIADRVTWASLASGETLFSRGDAADAAYLVVSGRLGVTDLETVARPGSRDREIVGEKIAPTVIEVGRGGIVGEFGLLEDRVRNATVLALRDTTLARLGARDFATLGHNHTALAMGLVRRVLARSGSETATASSNRTFALAITADVDDGGDDDITSTMVQALRACGPTTHLSSASVDRILQSTGIADTEYGLFGEVRLAELLHQSETESDHVVLDAGPGVRSGAEPNWVHRAFHHADQIVIVCSPDPDDAEAAVIRRLLDAAPAGIGTWLALLHPADTARPRNGAVMRTRFDVDEVHHLRDRRTGDLERLARLAAGRGVGLVLSGGGARGHAHIGVHAALVEAGIPIDRVVGASMGSIIAGGIGQQLSPPELLAAMQDGAAKLLDYTLPFVSLIKGERIVEVLERQFGGWETDDMWVPVSFVSTDLTTARVVVHRDGSAARAIRTSVAIPGVLPPVSYDNHLLADGGILDNLPAGVLGSDPSVGVIIASDVAPPHGPTAKDDHGLSVSGWSVALSRYVPLSVRRAQRALRRVMRRTELDTEAPTRYPGIGATLLRSLLIGSSRRRDEHLAAGIIDLYLELDLRDVPLLDFALVTPSADAGLEQSQPLIHEWLAGRGGSPWGTPPEQSNPEPEREPLCS